MSPLVAILIVLLLAGVVALLAAPLRERRRRETESPSDEREREREDLEAAREAKYREIRDCELDFRTGKLSAEDYAAIDAQLRAEALEILDRLEPSTPRGA